MFLRVETIRRMKIPFENRLSELPARLSARRGGFTSILQKDRGHRIKKMLPIVRQGVPSAFAGALPESTVVRFDKTIIA